LIKLFRTLFLTNRFFYALGSIATLFVVGFFAPFVFTVAQVLLLMLAILTLIEIVVLYRQKNGVELLRVLPERLSNGDENKISLQLKNKYSFDVFLNMIEELPYQFQKRDFYFTQTLTKQEDKTLHYFLTPKERGVYTFGKVNVYTSSKLKLTSRKYQKKKN
jgi:uncharacterized protein (DUF58 family)